MLDLALASVALPTIYHKAIDTFSESNRSTNKKNENQFKNLVPKPPINMTKDVSKEVKKLFGDDFKTPSGGFELAKVPAKYS